MNMSVHVENSHNSNPMEGKKKRGGKVQTLLPLYPEIKPQPPIKQEVDTSLKDVGNSPPQLSITLGDEQQCKKFKMGGIDVSFPPGKTPFPSQMMVMSKMIAALQNKQNALIESPTGTGKTLSLLCAGLAWQNSVTKSQLQNQRTNHLDCISGSMADTMRKVPASDAPPIPIERMAWKGDVASRRSVSDTGRAATITLQYEEAEDDTMLNDTKESTGMQCDTFSGREEQCRRTGNVIGEMVEASSLQHNEMKQQSLPKSDIPTIYFCSRTHSQLMQAVKELRSCEKFLHIVNEKEEDKFMECGHNEATTGLPKRMYKSFTMTMLASRKHYCINRKAMKHVGGLDEGCKELCEGKLHEKCAYRGRSSVLAPNLPAIWDVEDAVREGKMLAGCPYYASREKQQQAQLVFCPYNYILDPGVQASLGIDLSGAVVIIDEAHNIADVCRDGASCRVSLFSITQTVQLLERDFTDQKKHFLYTEYRTIKEFLAIIRSWMVKQASSNKLQKDKFSDRCHMEFNGSDALNLFWNDLKLTGYHITSVQDALETIKNINHEYKADGEPLLELGGKNLSLIGGILNALKYFYSKAIKGGLELDHSMSNEEHFRVVLMKEMEETEYETHLAIWCMSPHLVFQDVSRMSSSVILTSGTLSPLDSFATELGSDFPIRVEAPHVINVQKQCLVMGINSMGGIVLDGKYKNQQEEQYQDTIGEAILRYSECLRGGILVFLSSYSFMDKLVNRWRKTGCLAAIERLKTFGMEPKGSGKDINIVLERHYRAVEVSRKGDGARCTHPCIASHDDSKNGWKQIKRRKNWNSQTIASENPILAQTGAVLLAVCRGKVSEGLDFSDDYARLTCIVGIPYGSQSDLKLKLKQEYQDLVAKKDQQHINGHKWYMQQAFRAVNQAMGRCIRHRHDFGAICLVDPRYSMRYNISTLSKWLRNQIRMDLAVESSLEYISHFFHGLTELEQSIELPTKSLAGQLEATAAKADTKATANQKTEVAIHATRLLNDQVSCQEARSNHEDDASILDEMIKEDIIQGTAFQSIT